MEKQIYQNEFYISGDRDYLNYVSKTSTKEQRREFNIGDVYINGAVCVNCGDFIRSKNRHDFKYCSCESIAVDGGSWYPRRLGDEYDYIDVLEFFYDVEQEAKEHYGKEEKPTKEG